MFQGVTGNDTFKVYDFTGNDYFDGGEGTDTIIFNPDDNRDLKIDVANGTVADDDAGAQNFSNIEAIYSGNGNDTLIGGSGNETLSGGAGNDILRGGAGNDTFEVYDFTGFDFFDGGEGTDTIIFNPNDNRDLDIRVIVGDVQDYKGGYQTYSNIEAFYAGNGNDTLTGGSGDETLAGGAGNNELSGGEGSDVFVMDTNGVQIIKDFERGIDTIDMAGTQVNEISFNLDNTDYSSILVNGTERVRIEGSLVDSNSLINTSNDINPQSLTADQVNNISEMLLQWAENYAESLGYSTSDVSFVNNQLSIVGGDLTFIDWGTEETETDQGLEIENMTRNASMFFRNNSSADSSMTFTYSDGQGYEVSNEDTTTLEISNTIGGSLQYESPEIAKLAAGKITVQATYEHNWVNGTSQTTINTDNVNTVQDTSINFTAPAGTVTLATATATGGEYSGGEYEIPLTISGTIGIDLNGDGDTLDDSEINDLPVNAILQYYNPEQFIGEGFQSTTELPTGQVLIYNESTQAKVTGTADGAYFSNVVASVASAYDWSLTNPTASEYEDGVNYQEQGQAIEERYWLIRNGEYGARPSGATLRIEGFTLSEDFIGIEHNAINSADDILLGTDVTTGLDPADKLILKSGSYTQNGITYDTTQILMGGTGDDFNTIEDNDVLAELIGVSPDQLLGSSDGSPRTSLTRGDLDTNFMFGTQGTIWDNDLATGDGTNLLQLLETV